MLVFTIGFFLGKHGIKYFVRFRHQFWHLLENNDN